jgi:hypothetical protein
MGHCHFDHIRCRGLGNISCNPPEVYSYLALFVPTRLKMLNAVLGPGPLAPILLVNLFALIE